MPQIRSPSRRSRDALAAAKITKQSRYLLVAHTRPHGPLAHALTSRSPHTPPTHPPTPLHHHHPRPSRALPARRSSRQAPRSTAAARASPRSTSASTASTGSPGSNLAPRRAPPPPRPARWPSRPPNLKPSRPTPQRYCTVSYYQHSDIDSGSGSAGGTNENVVYGWVVLTRSSPTPGRRRPRCQEGL